MVTTDKYDDTSGKSSPINVPIRDNDIHKQLSRSRTKRFPSREEDIKHIRCAKRGTLAFFITKPSNSSVSADVVDSNECTFEGAYSYMPKIQHN